MRSDFNKNFLYLDIKKIKLIILPHKKFFFVFLIYHSVLVGTSGSNPSSSTGITNSANLPS